MTSKNELKHDLQSNGDPKTISFLRRCADLTQRPAALRALCARISMIVALTVLAAACSPESRDSETLIVYSGRSESLVGPLIERFSETTGLEVDVRWGDTAELAATLLEEGSRSPADVFLAQDPGGLGAVMESLTPLPMSVLESVEPRFRGPDGRWVGVSGRSRVIVYNTERVAVDSLPDDIRELTAPEWKSRIGWAPTNGSFQSMVTAMRAEWGDAETRDWLSGIVANEPIAYEKNTPIVAAVGAGEIDVGLVNHYYLHRFLAEEGDDFPARNHFLSTPGPGSLLLVSGVGILNGASNSAGAEDFVRFLLSEEAQTHFTDETYEYPLASGAVPSVDLPDLETLAVPEIPMESLSDLLGSVELLRDVGALP